MRQAAMVSNIFLSLARLPIDVSYRALKDLVKETDSDINCVNYLEILFFHPIMVAFWDEVGAPVSSCCVGAFADT